MTTKVRALTPIIEGTAIAVVPKRKKGEKLATFRERKATVLSQYSDSGVLDVKYGAIIAPKEFSNQRARLERGMVQMIRPLKNGTEEYVILPFKPANANDLIERLIDDPSLNGLKDETEYFSFRLYGHNSQQALFTAKEMGQYLQQYKVLQGDNANDAIKHLTFQRFRGDPVETEQGGNASPHDSTEPKIIHKRADDTGRNSGRRKDSGTWQQQRRAKDARRKKEQRAKEAPVARERRLRKNAIREAQRRQRMFEES